MRIKEVEQRTGLTAKAIRLYESKGLLSISREAENEYRDYTEADVTHLKIIALLRKMDIPVKTIKLWTDGDMSLQEIMQAAAQSCRADSQASQEKSKLAEELSKILEDCPEEDLPELAEDVGEIQSLLQALQEESYRVGGNLIWPVWASIVTLGPVGFVIIYILQGQTERALLAFALSMISVGMSVLQWKRYWNTPRKDREKSGCLSIFAMCVAILVLMFGFMVGLQQLQQTLFVPDSQMIWVFRSPWSILVFVFEIELILLAFALLIKAFPAKKGRYYLVILVLINVVLLYGCITGVSVADETGITRHSVLAPQGTQYTFEDVVKVETGFRGKLFGWIPGRGTGDFYYKLHYSDGSVEDWGESNSEATEESWAWMLLLDQWLMEAGVAKEGSTENSQYCQMDQEYVDILIRVVENQLGNS